MSLSPALPRRRNGYAGWRIKIEINSEGVESNRGEGDATALRLMIYLDDDPG
jgi:hypothetical protein